MRHLSSILLMLILLFNFIGYRLLIDFFIHQKNLIGEQMLMEESYSDEDLISFKTPISLPYYNNSVEFEKVYGAVEVDGVVYRYVKRRIFNDSLELLCLPDHSKKNLAQVKNQLFKLSTHLGSGRSSENAPLTIKGFSPDYWQEQEDFRLSLLCLSQHQPDIYFSHTLSKGHQGLADRPPEAKEYTL